MYIFFLSCLWGVGLRFVYNMFFCWLCPRMPSAGNRRFFCCVCILFYFIFVCLVFCCFFMFVDVFLCCMEGGGISDLPVVRFYTRALKN